MDAGYDDINNYTSNHVFGFNPRDEYDNLSEFLATELIRRDKDKYNNTSKKYIRKIKNASGIRKVVMNM